MGSLIARGKFREPADSDTVLDSEYIVTFEPQTPPSVIEEAARQVQATNPGVRFRLIATDGRGWQGLAYKVPPQLVEETAALLQSLLVRPEARSAEANMIVRALRPAPADPEQLGAFPQMPAEPVAAVPAAELLATETAAAAAGVPPSAETAAAEEEAAAAEAAAASAGPEAGPAEVPVMELAAAGLAASTEADPAIVSAASIGSGKMSGPVSAANTNCASRAGAIMEQVLNFAELWGLDRIDTRTRSLDRCYRHSSQGTGVHLFVADTGILPGHAEFGGRVLLPGAGGFDAFPGGDGVDRNGHGTHCAGTIGGATVGVAKDVTLVSVKVLGDNGSGSTDTVIAGINHVIESSLQNKILSMSLGGGASNALDEAVNKTTNRGVLVVAAGNENRNACLYSPARAASAITVGATTNSDSKSSFSNFGSCVHIWAPGSSILSAWASGTSACAFASGTSFAAPHVAGAAARFWSAGLCNSPLSCTEVLMCWATRNIVGGISRRESSNSNPFLHIPAGI